MARFLGPGLRKLLGRSDGSAALLVALSLPALIGASGLAVDTAQWYLWKAELQFAVDQAALAGAWARSDPESSSLYRTRGAQEYDGNLQIVADFASRPDISLVDYQGGSDNAVEVTASVSHTLPFSNIFLARPVVISARAMASVTQGDNHTGCLVALDPSASGAFTLGGSVSGEVTCGAAALSNSSTAMRKNGNSDAQLGSLVSAGGIDSGFSENGTLYPNATGISDPFGDVAAPASTGHQSRTYTCPAARPAVTTTTADKTIRTIVTYTYKKGANANNGVVQTGYTGTGYLANSDSTSGPVNETVPNGTLAGTTTSGPTVGSAVQVSGSGNNRIWRIPSTTVKTTYSNIAVVVIPANDGVARPQPGIYSTISVACKTVFAPGIYFVDDIDFGQNQIVIGSDVMFVIREAGGMHINSKSNLSLTGITADTLTSIYGYDSEEANKLAGMVIYDPDTTAQFKMNGNADLHLEGTIYMPKREIWFNGNSTASGTCMMIVANQITFTGNNDLESFCVPDGNSPLQLGGGQPTVRLVS